ncbi:Cpn2 [Symbiodinium sp. CCMP2592]|nr:Cpn2 [Symbiodinium sp. CCMP2592]
MGKERLIPLLLAVAVLYNAGAGDTSNDDVATALRSEEADCPEALRLLQRRQRRSLEMAGDTDLAQAGAVDCSSVEILDLSGSRITRWPFRPGQSCPQLQNLDLSDNLLQELPDGAFVGMPNLTVLRLAHNGLMEFPNMTGLRSLWELDLSSNAISSIPAGALFDNPEVVHLDLSRNELSDLPSSGEWLPESNVLSYLTVAHNRISSLGDAFLRGFEDLDWLDLSGNGLMMLDPESFAGVEDLDNLLLIGNPLGCRLPLIATCFCPGDCSANTTREAAEEGDEEDGEDEDEDEIDDGPLIKVPASWCELPLCISKRSVNSSSNASVARAERETFGNSTSGSAVGNVSNTTYVAAKSGSSLNKTSASVTGGSSNTTYVEAKAKSSGNSTLASKAENISKSLDVVYSAATKIPKEKEGEASADAGEASVPEEQAQEVEAAMEDALPSFLQTAWAYVVRDIDKTVRDVGRKFLQDKSVPWQIRIRRAQALQRLGQVFVSEGALAAKAAAASSVPDPGAANAEAAGPTSAAKAVLQEAFELHSKPYTVCCAMGLGTTTPKGQVTEGRLRRHLVTSVGCVAQWGSFQPTAQAVQAVVHPLAPPMPLDSQLPPSVVPEQLLDISVPLLEALEVLEGCDETEVFEVVESYVEPLPMLRKTVRTWGDNHLGSAWHEMVVESLLLVLDPDVLAESRQQSVRPPAISSLPPDKWPSPSPLPMTLSGEPEVKSLMPPPSQVLSIQEPTSMTVRQAVSYVMWLDAATALCAECVETVRTGPVSLLCPGLKQALGPGAVWLEAAGFAFNPIGMHSAH